MDFDEATLEELAASAEAHTQRLAAISASAVKRSTELRQAMSNGNYDRVHQLLYGETDDITDATDGKSGGSLDENANGGSVGGPAE